MIEGVAGGWDCHVHVFDAARPAREGHYVPAHRPLEQIEAVAAAHGIGHLVLVQPSVYGSDNRLLLESLVKSPRRHRGVVVLDDEPSDAELDAMHAAGVRGVRLNLVSPVGEQGDPALRFARLAPRLRERGWHLQWYLEPRHFAAVAAMHRGSGVTCVLDHLAGLRPDLPRDDPAWQGLDALADQGAWVKLSGWYRLGAVEPYAELAPVIRQVAQRFCERLAWGSDWPHTAFAPEAMPDHATTWRPVLDALGAEAAAALRNTLPAIYA